MSLVQYGVLNFQNITPRTEKQMERNMETGMEARVTWSAKPKL